MSQPVPFGLKTGSAQIGACTVAEKVFLTIPRLQLKADVEPIADVEKIQTKTKTETKTETKRVKTPTRGRFAPLAQVPPTSFPFSFPFSFSFEFSQHPQLAQHPP